MDHDDPIERIRGRTELADFRRDGMNVSDLRGVVLAATDELILLGVAGDDVRPNGYAVIARDDVTFLRWGTERLAAWQRTLSRNPDEDARVGSAVRLWGWADAAASVRGFAALTTFHRERLDSSTCYIARDFEVVGDWLVGEQVTTEGECDGRFALRLADLTRIDFGGGYEQGLARLLG